MDEHRSGTRVYVDMVGDPFHVGHVRLLEAARQHGDHLVVGVLSDETVAAYKRRDVSPDTVREVFGPVAAAGRLRLVRYTPGISTTDLIARVRASA